MNNSTIKIIETLSKVDDFDSFYKVFLKLLNNLSFLDFIRLENQLLEKKELIYLANSSNIHRYKSFHIPKKSGGFRVIYAPTRKLYPILKAVQIVLEYYYNPPRCVHGFVRNKSIVTNASVHCQQNYILNIDLQDYFPSIRQGRVWKRLQLPPFNFSDITCRIFAGLACVEYVGCNGEKFHGLPQGSPASPILSNIILEQLDRKIIRLTNGYNITYSRYADDMTFSSKINVFREGKPFRYKLNQLINENGFILNDKKTRLFRPKDRKEVTGLVVSETVNCSKSYIDQLKKILHIWDKFGYVAAFQRFAYYYGGNSGCNDKGILSMESVLRGKLAYMCMVKGDRHPLCVKLGKKFEKLLKYHKKIIAHKPKFYTIIAYKLAEFWEIDIHPMLKLYTDKHGKYVGTVTINGQSSPVYFDKIFSNSRYAEKVDIVTKILNRNSNWFISLVESENKFNNKNPFRFWLISKKRPSPNIVAYYYKSNMPQSTAAIKTISAAELAKKIFGV